jgi:hypothetical protein
VKHFAPYISCRTQSLIPTEEPGCKILKMDINHCSASTVSSCFGAC